MNSRNIQIVLLAALTLMIAACDPSESVEKEATEPGYLTEEMPPCTPAPGSSVDACEAERRGAFIGEARRNGSPTIVAYVNGHPITAADIAEVRARATVNLAGMRDAISRIVPDWQAFTLPQETPLATPLVIGEVSITVYHDPTIDPPIYESYGIRRNFEARIAIIEEHGLDTAALAKNVSEIAMFTAATAAGHTADPADIDARIAEIKTALDDGLIPELEGYLSAVGEDVYFAEVLPANLTRQLAVESWLGGLTHRLWRDAERNAIAKVQVALTGEPGLDTTLEGLSTYLDAYWALDAASTSPPSCRNGSAVPNSDTDWELLRDCSMLLAAKDTLRGTGTLNWSVDTPIGRWDGVTVEGTPERVTVLDLSSRRLTGEIAVELSNLDKLRELRLANNRLTGEVPIELWNLGNLETLQLSNNQLSGAIPPELGALTGLRYLYLGGNSLTGCIPPALRDVPTNDLDSLGLQDCPAGGA